MDPVRKWTLHVLGLCVVLFAWYLVSDRITPYTTQARVHALVVPIVSEVSGTVTDVGVGTNQYVKAGDVLFRVDPSRYELEVETAEATLQAARQATGASSANVEVARAAVASAEASLVRAEQDAVRLRRIKEEDPGAISDRRLESAEASLSVARGQVAAAEAGLEMAIQQLGQEGENNSGILQAQAALEHAQLNLARTVVVAPDDGLVSDVRVDRGNFAQAGAPNMTFISVHNIWVQADFTENNLGNIKAGDPVGLVFDVLPGRVFKGRVRGSGFGVAVDSAPLGSLPTIENDRQWLRSAQRFPVVVDFEIEDSDEALGLRVGAQASVMVHTGENTFLNALGRFQLWLVSKLTYAY
ncbi:MAG: HlyD family secretion protein [Verrucomicrobia bacterium]|nr:MAG: HlyD family secretion protein [Verrucomicrobiota bacterium]